MTQYRTTQSEKEFLSLLRKKYKPPHYAVLKQVPIPVADSRTRTVDAIVIGAWQSRGACILGFEMKASRSDWTHELSKPRKAEEGAHHCDAWYIVAHEGVVLKEEIPPNWGLYIVRHNKLDLVKEAVRLSPKEPTRELFFSILQTFIDQLNPVPEEVMLQEQYEKGYKDGESNSNTLFRRTLKEIYAERKPQELDEIERLLLRGPNDLRAARVKMAEELIGLFTYWNDLTPTKHAIEAIQFIAEGGLRTLSVELLSLRDKAKHILDDIDRSLSCVDETQLEVTKIDLPQAPLNGSPETPP